MTTRKPPRATPILSPICDLSGLSSTHRPIGDPPPADADIAELVTWSKGLAAAWTTSLDAARAEAEAPARAAVGSVPELVLWTQGLSATVSRDNTPTPGVPTLDALDAKGQA